MNRVNYVLLKMVRISGWPLLPLVMLFLLTGYSVSGQYGFSRLMDEKTAVALHKLGHLPLLVLLLAHTLPATWLALQRWGWIKHGAARPPKDDRRSGLEPASALSRGHDARA
jgi:succinate dehydrogenase/fumarate reductase cytochrome b subunit